MIACGRTVYLARYTGSTGFLLGLATTTIIIIIIIIIIITQHMFAIHTYRKSIGNPQWVKLVASTTFTAVIHQWPPVGR